jgi:hypothetical protein
LLDEDGYLTIYHGRSQRTMHGANSWTFNRDNALRAGQHYAWAHGSPNFYCVTGKVRLADVIAYIPNDPEHQIVVLQKNVQDKTKELHDSKDTF